MKRRLLPALTLAVAMVGLVVAAVYLEAARNGQPLRPLNVTGALTLATLLAIGLLVIWPPWLPVIFDWIVGRLRARSPADDGDSRSRRSRQPG